MARRLLVLTVALLAGATVAHAVQRPRKAQVYTVTIEGMQFKPSSLTIRAGDTVTWINKDVVAHTATSASTPAVFDSRVIPPEKSWKQTFKAKGQLPYVCTYHPTMKGTIRVQ